MMHSELFQASQLNVQLFYQEAGKPLYRHAITDDLPAFVHGIDDPAPARGIRSKSLMVRQMQRLSLEYIDKRRPTYATLLRRGDGYWTMVDRRSIIPTDSDMMPICQYQRVNTASALSRLAGLLDFKSSLGSVSCCAFLGGQTEIWGPLAQSDLYTNVVASDFTMCRAELVKLLIVSRAG